MHTLDFTDHRRELDANRYIYAVLSRRSQGLSVGINLNPDKACNFDCPYCQVDRSVPGGPRTVDLGRLETELDHLFGLAASGQLWSVAPFDTAPPAMRRMTDMAFAGDGEPTSCRVFPEAVELVGRLRAKHGLGSVAVVLLTNATLFHRPRVALGLARLADIGGEIWAKLDAGTEAWFHLIDGTSLPFDRVLANIAEAARQAPLTLQCMFHTWDGEGPSDAEVEAWTGRLADIQAGGGTIALVQVYSVARRPADPRVGVLPTPRLEQIAAHARGLGLRAVVYPGIESR